MMLSENKILVLDGAMGTMIQRYALREGNYSCGPFEGWAKDLAGNNECLNLTHPEIILEIHKEYIQAGADIIESNTFSANRISQSEYGCEEWAGKMAFEGARLARQAADEVLDSCGRKVWVAGSIGPTSKSLSLSPDASDPMFRPYSFEQMKEAYREQAEGLIRGGVDMILIETCFDALNVKAALAAIDDACHHACISEDPRLRSTQAPPSRGWHVFSNTMHDARSHRNIPIIVSVSVGDRSGRTLTGQTLEAFYTSVKHGGLMAFGVNCSLGAAELMPLVEDIASWCGCGVSCYPNAGLPNEMGGYDQSPEEMAAQVREMAVRGLVNIVGGCCGTTPEHIRAIAQAVDGLAPRGLSAETGCFVNGKPESSLKVSGLEAVNIDMKVNNFTNVGERTNVAGSRKFARLISEGKYEEGLQIAAKQIEDGASVIDINMDDAMLDSTREMERFVRCISNDPDVAKAALMIDSSRWETIIAGLQNAQGKCIVNSISLKEGAEAFVEKARIIRSYGAAVVVMAFDEQGQATTFERKIEICRRAYDLLTREVGMNPCDIIFDVNILSIGTGIEEHARYAVDFIEAVRWIKANLPGALTSGGVSNLSFAFRGNNAVREAMHSAFLYHAIRAGLDMAIVNPSMLQVYDEIDPELLKCVEDVIFDTDPQATERLIDKASRMLADSHAGAGEAHSHPERSGADTCPPERSGAESKDLPPVSLRLQNSLIKGRTDTLETDIREALEEFGSAVAVIEGPLMEGMETVGKQFGEGKMFLPQVVKSAKVMRDAVEILEPYMNLSDSRSEDHGCHVGKAELDCHVERAERVETSVSSKRSTVVLATVKGDVHDIGKNITGIVLTCNGFDVHDLGVMVDKETILDEAAKVGADIVAVSGLITPSLYQMEEICREMNVRGMDTPLFIGGATTSAVHTAVKLAPLYDHVFYGADASAAAVMAKKCMMDREAFEAEQHARQEEVRRLYYGEISPLPSVGRNDNEGGRNDNEGGRNDNEGGQNDNGKGRDGNLSCSSDEVVTHGFEYDTYLTECPADIPVCELPASEVLPFFDWKMFYAIWGVKYGGAVPEAMELMQLRRDAEDEIALGDFRIMLTARFFMGCSTQSDEIRFEADGAERTLPMMRQENGKEMSLCDFVIPEQSGRKSPFGMFAISVHKRSKAHVHGCSCPACSNHYEDLVGRTVRMTLAEAASAWLDALLLQGPPSHRFAVATPPSRGWHVPSAIKASNHQTTDPIKVIKPAAGYASCPDHTLKGDILELLCGHETGLGIELTESYAMTPESSICGMVFMHPQACYPEIRKISREAYEDYARRRGMDDTTARRFLGHLLK